MDATLAALAVVVATILGVTALIPQIVKLVRTGDPAGISATWPAIGLVSNAAWSAYLIQAGLWPASISTSSMIGFYALVLWALRPAGAPLRRPVVRGIVWGAVLAMITAGAGWFVLGTVLGFSQFIQMAPAIWTAYRTAIPSGISAVTWWISGIEGTLWGYYGWYHGDIPVMIFAATFFTTAVLMLARYHAVVRSPAYPPEMTRSAS